MDLKRELEPGKKANTDLAQDIAAFAIHGGLVLIGVTEGPPVELNSVPLQGLPERIEQIARMKVDEGLAVTATPIPARDDPTVGYVAIHVPRSPRAPHMVDGRYYARGAKTNIVLSDQRGAAVS